MILMVILVYITKIDIYTNVMIELKWKFCTLVIIILFFHPLSFSLRGIEKDNDKSKQNLPRRRFSLGVINCVPIYFTKTLTQIYGSAKCINISVVVFYLRNLVRKTSYCSGTGLVLNTFYAFLLANTNAGFQNEPF